MRATSTWEEDCMRSKIGGRGTRGVRKMVAAGCVAAGLVLATVASAQAPAVTAGDYARAEKFLAHNTAPLVDHVPAMLDWIDDDQFTWRDHDAGRSEEHTSELQSLMRISYAVFCLKNKSISTC